MDKILRSLPKPIAGALTRALGAVVRMDDEADHEDITRFVFSSPIEARDGDIWAPPWDTTAYDGNPVVPWAHDYSAPPVGRVVELEVNGENQLVGAVQWDMADEFGARIAGQYRRGFLNAVSVGCRPGKVTRRSELPEEHEYYKEDGWSYLLTDNEVLEISAVPVPSDHTALAQRGVYTSGARASFSANPADLVTSYLESPEGRLALEGVVRDVMQGQAEQDPGGEVVELGALGWPVKR